MGPKNPQDLITTPDIELDIVEGKVFFLYFCHVFLLLNILSPQNHSQKVTAVLILSCHQLSLKSINYQFDPFFLIHRILKF